MYSDLQQTRVTAIEVYSYMSLHNLHRYRTFDIIDRVLINRQTIANIRVGGHFKFYKKEDIWCSQKDDMVHRLPTYHAHAYTASRTYTQCIQKHLLLLLRSKINEYQYLFSRCAKSSLFQKQKGSLSRTVYFLHFCPLLAISRSFLLANSFLYMAGHSSEKLQVRLKLAPDGG